MKDGRICFIKTKNGYTREKNCRPTQTTPQEVRKYFAERFKQTSTTNQISFRKEFLSLLDRRSSHLEFNGTEGKMLVRQRCIYTSNIITIKPDHSQGVEGHLLQPFEPMGLRTKDFCALFSFSNEITFYFSGRDIVLFRNRDGDIPFEGFVNVGRYGS